jgi:sorting and assembly machinery component 37
LDISLFVSSRNYETVTRPLYSAILPWPIQYFTPPKLRSAAKARTEHLGLSALDVDSPNEKGTSQAPASAATAAAQIPQSLKRPKETVTTVLTQPVHASQFRLDALMTSVLEPLQELLGEKRFFFSDKQISSLDCLVLGYLALFLYPDLPQSWLADTMRSKYSKLCGYVDDLRGRFLGCPITIHDFRVANQKSCLQGREDNRALHYTVLPWVTPEKRGFSQVGSLLLENIIDSLPLAQHLHKANRTYVTISDTDVKDPKSSSDGNGLDRASNSQVLAIAAGVSAAVGYLFYIGLSIGEKQKTSLRDLGEAGAILSRIGDYNAITKEQPASRGDSSSG